MKEIRRDSITGDLVIYTSYRSKRPHDKTNTLEVPEEAEEYSMSCPFCRNNEKQNDDLKEAIVEDGLWVAKSVGNKFPIIDMSTDDIFGEHEVLVETYRHNGSFYNMTIDEFYNFFKLFQNRYRNLSEKENIKYVNFFKNYKRNSGASLMHPHSQITSFNIIPPEIEKELRVAWDFYEENKKSLYDELVDSEIKHKDRVVYNGKKYLVIIPHATRYNGEIRIIQKDSTYIEDYTEEYIEEISYIFRELFEKWGENQGDIPFNVIIHTYPLDKDYRDIFRTHFHIIPRKYNFGGFELSSNLFVCGTNPEELASELKFV